MILDRVKAFAEAKPENLTPLIENRMSSAGECVRKLWYERHSEPVPIDFKSYCRMELGTAAHLFLQVLLKETFQDDYYDVEKEIYATSPGVKEQIVGHSDGRIKSLQATVELKSVSDSTFQLVQKENKPLDPHIEQANMYAVTQGDSNILAVYINRDSGEMCEFMFEVDGALYESTLQKYRLAQYEEIPGRPYSDMTGSPCFYCPFKEVCYEGFKEEVRNYSQATFDQSHPAVGEAADIVHFRRVRLASEKEEKKRKENLIKIMTDLKINQATFKSEDKTYEGELTVGKNQNPLLKVEEVTK